MDPAIWVALAACVAGCYFAACNIALKTFSKTRLAEQLEALGRLNRLDRFVDRVPKLMLMTGMVRTCLGLVVLLATLDLVERKMLGSAVPDAPAVSRFIAYSIAFVISGVLVTVFAVAVPTSWARYHPEALLARTMPVLEGCLVAFNPIASALHVLDPIIRRITGVSDEDAAETAMPDELLSVVEEHQEEGSVDQSQREMLEAVFELPSTTAGEIMTPRTDVHGLEVTASLQEVKAAVLDAGHSRIPVYEESLDHIVGVLFAKDLLKLLGSDQRFELRQFLREAFMVPESKPLRELLAEFKSRKTHMAIVIDEYGGTAGLVTIEDIIEEIVGDIQDEYEPTADNPEIRRIDDRVTEADARVYVDDINDAMEIALPEDEDYDTLGGFVISTLGRIPRAGESFEFQQLRLTVVAAERNKVSRVRIERLESSSATETDVTGK